MDPSCLIGLLGPVFIKVWLKVIYSSSHHGTSPLEVVVILDNICNCKWLYFFFHKFGGEKSENKSFEFGNDLWQNDPMRLV